MLQEHAIRTRFFQSLTDVFTLTMLESPKVFPEKERNQFLSSLNAFAADTTLDTIREPQVWAETASTMHALLAVSSPIIYEAIRFKHINTLGPLEAIMSMNAEFQVEKAWNIIKKKTKNGSCEAFDRLLQNSLGTAAATRVGGANFTELCKVSRTTMFYWYNLLNYPHSDIRIEMLLNTFTDKYSVFEFYEVVHAYRPTAYETMFEKSPVTGEYPVLESLYHAMHADLYNDEEISLINNVAGNLQQNFDHLDLLGRQRLLSTRFTSVVDQNQTYLGMLGGVKLLHYPGNLYDLIMWWCQQETLEAAYLKASKSN